MKQIHDRSRSPVEDSRFADPYPHGLTSTDPQSQVFEEKRRRPDGSDFDEHGLTKRRPGTPLIAILSAAIVVVVAVVGYSLVKSPSVEAEMLAAARNPLMGEQGKVAVISELSNDDPDAPIALLGRLNFRYSDDDFAFSGELGDLSGQINFDAELVSKNDQLFFRTPGDGMWVSLRSQEYVDLSKIVTNYIPTIANFDGESLERLFLLADNVSRAEDGDTKTFTGTVATAEVLDLGIKNLPAVLLPFVMQQEGFESLPENFEVEMVTIDEVIDSVSVRVEDFSYGGELISGYATADLSNAGEVEPITAPDPSAVLTAN